MKKVFHLKKLRSFFLKRSVNAISGKNMLSFEKINNLIWNLNSEIFLPCAASRLITKDQVEKMLKSGIEVIAPGANVPFADEEIFFGPISDYTDKNTSLIPDFISNCGMARVFAYLMGNDLETIDDESIFKDTSETIKNALENIFKKF